MLIHRYWARGSATTHKGGAEFPVHCWAGSSISEADAQQLADTKAANLAAHIRQAGQFPEAYPYDVRPLREEIIREFRGPTHELSAVITRNQYGAEVLNSASVLFVDVDLPVGSGETLWQRLVRWWRQAPPPKPLDEALQRLLAWLDSHPEWGARIYRTAGGLRYLVTHAPFAPGSTDAEAMMVAVGCDPQYLRLCRAQRSFRARLSPKPWRCGVPHPPDLRPPLDTAARSTGDTWQALYAAASCRFATCSFGGSFGNPEVAAEVQPILALHDDATRATSDLPLA